MRGFFPSPSSVALHAALVILVAAYVNSSTSSTIENDESTSTESSTEPEEFPLAPPPDDDNTEYGQEEVYDLDELEEKLGGRLDNRRFVILEPITGRKIMEVPYKFRTRGKPRPVRHHTDPIVDLRWNVTKENVDKLKEIPEGQGFNSSTVYVRYDKTKLTALENTGDSSAQLGDPCRATNILEFDYCERAAFPNKGKMVCNTVDDPSRGLVPNTCICKYYRLHPKTPKWKQLKSFEINDTRNGNKNRTVCLIPLGGVCNHRISTGMWNRDHRAIYEVDICRGHFQCDNTNITSTSRDMRSHCTEKEFLETFDKARHDEVLLCSKPHSRKFADYDEYKYYCLPSRLRDPDEGVRSTLPQYTKYDAVEVDEEKDIL